MNTQEIVEHWLQQIESIPAKDFIPISDFTTFASRARTESLQWCEILLNPAANPHSPQTNSLHSYYLAGRVGLDLLLHEYTIDDQSVRIFEGVNFLIVSFTKQQSEVWTNKSLDDLTKLVLHTVDQPYAVNFQYPPNLSDNILISTAPSVDPIMMVSWSQRKDMLLRHGKLYIVFYKRQQSPIMGLQHDAQWFEDELRDRIKP